MLTLLFLGTLLLAPPSAPIAMPPPVAQFAARLGYDPAGAPTARENMTRPPTPWPVLIAIERWSTDAQTDALVRALNAGGVDALRSALDRVDPPAGHLSPGFPREGAVEGWGVERLAFAQQVRDPDGTQRFVLLTAPAGFGWVEFRIAPNGTGEGFVALGAGVCVAKDGKSLELTGARERLRLTGVRRQ